MSAHLALVQNLGIIQNHASFTEMLSDHQALLQGYLDTHVTRNHSNNTIEAERRFLTGWFEGFMVQDDEHPDGQRQLFLWEAMEPMYGRQRIVGFSKGLIYSELKPRTVQNHLGALRRLFQYIIEYPYIPGTVIQSAISKYGRIEQPVLEYDYPVHVLDQEEEGMILTGDQLLQFYNFVRLKYIANNQKRFTASRNYTMIVIAAETGLRADEILHLDAFGSHKDIFYEHNCIQTRYGKGTKGSGKRTRKTIFTPFAQETVRIYIDQIRPHFPNARISPALFLAENGKRIGYKAMWRNLSAITQAARKTGLEMPPSLSWHSLRKSFATNFMERHPGSPWVLMDFMGHLNPSSLHRYVKHSRVYYDQTIENIIKETMEGITEMKGVM